jgi:hypothetical protein
LWITIHQKSQYYTGEKRVSGDSYRVSYVLKYLAMAAWRQRWHCTHPRGIANKTGDSQNWTQKPMRGNIWVVTVQGKWVYGQAGDSQNLTERKKFKQINKKKIHT